MVKELFILIKLIFKKPTINRVYQMRHFPFKGYSAMMWFGYMITRNKYLKTTTYNHEYIHIMQSNDSYFTYYLKYFWNWIKHNPFKKYCYYFNKYEIEAYANQHDSNYKHSKESLKKYDIKNPRKIFKDVCNNSIYAWKNHIKSL